MNEDHRSPIAAFADSRPSRESTKALSTGSVARSIYISPSIHNYLIRKIMFTPACRIEKFYLQVSLMRHRRRAKRGGLGHDVGGAHGAQVSKVEFWLASSQRCNSQILSLVIIQVHGDVGIADHWELRVEDWPLQDTEWLLTHWYLYRNNLSNNWKWLLRLFFSTLNYQRINSN